MYAIVEVGGMQWKVAKADKLRVPKMEGEPGKSLDLDKVLLFVNKEEVIIGKPLVENVKVKATVLSHGKAKKVKVFKKKRRKDYKVLRGHRQDYTEIHIDGIQVVKKVKKKTTAEKPMSAKTKEPSKTGAKKGTTPTKPRAKKTSTSAKAEVKKEPESTQSSSAKKTTSTKIKED